VESEWGGAADDKPAMKKMVSSMKKGSISNDILEEILWMYMFHEDSTARAAAKKAFMELAPEDAVQAVKKNWKATFRKSQKLGRDLGKLAKSLNRTSVNLVNLLIKVASILRSIPSTAFTSWHYPTLEALGISGDTRAVEPLVEYIRGYERYESRGEMIKAIQALGKLGGEAAIEALVEMTIPITIDKVTFVVYGQNEIKKALVKFGESAITPLGEVVGQTEWATIILHEIARKNLKGDEKKNVLRFLESDDRAMVRMGASLLKGAMK